MIFDRRTSPREDVYKPARIAFRGSRPILGCIVRNMSEGGACLAVETSVDIPDAFHLVFSTGEPYRNCYVMWRNEKHIGVAFA
jgi:hypothetical protein